ncbi:MAG: thiamine phosphate synthase [Clostridium sp.]
MELYLITNRKLCDEDIFLNVIKEASYSGVDKIILREKDLPTVKLEKLYKDILSVINTDCKVIINSNINLAKKYDAYGVQLSFRDFIQYNGSCGIKENIKFNGVVGVSIHSLEEAKEAEVLGADYILASHIYPTKCKEGLEPRGIEFIEEICKNTMLKVIGLGGISKYNFQEVVEAGASGIAVMSQIMGANNIYNSVNGFIKNF